MVVVGVKVRVPVAATVPTSGMILTVVAPVTDHVSVVLSPAVIDVGLAVNVVMTGMPAAVTVTTAVAVVSPALLPAVRVYVVEEDGDTDFVPEADTVPTPWLMETEVAPLTAHESVELLPEVIEAGLAEKLVISGGPDGFTVTLAVVVDGPASLAAVIV